MAKATYILGVGMTKFVKPRGKIEYTELGWEAGVKAMLDAHINYDDVDHGIACYCYGDSTCGQRVFYQFGMTGIPIFNVNNNCSTGSTGLSIARNLVSYGAGAANCVLVIGFEKMFPGSLQSFFRDRENPLQTTTDLMKETRGLTKAPTAAQMFGNAGKEYMEKFGATIEDFAEIARVNHEHSQRNPYSQFQDVYSLEQILDSPMIYEPLLTKLQCCPTSDGGAAAVVVSEDFLRTRPHLREQAVLIAGQTLATDLPDLFSKSSIDLVGYGMTKLAAESAMKEANVQPTDIKVCELHDCFSANEMVAIDALGLSRPGEAHLLVRNHGITYGGDGVVINPSGGLISKGHPLGATGLAQCAELVWQLRGWANNRLVESRVALQHNLGLGGAVVVTVYKRSDGKLSKPVNNETVGNINGLGYNPAVEAKGFTTAQANEVCSKKKRSTWAVGETEKKVLARF